MKTPEDAQWFYIGKSLVLLSESKGLVGRILMVDEQIKTDKLRRKVNELTREVEELHEMNQTLRQEIKSKTRLLREKHLQQDKQILDKAL